MRAVAPVTGQTVSAADRPGVADLLVVVLQAPEDLVARRGIRDAVAAWARELADSGMSYETAVPEIVSRFVAELRRATGRGAVVSDRRVQSLREDVVGWSRAAWPGDS